MQSGTGLVLPFRRARLDSVCMGDLQLEVCVSEQRQVSNVRSIGAHQRSKASQPSTQAACGPLSLFRPAPVADAVGHSLSPAAHVLGGNMSITATQLAEAVGQAFVPVRLAAALTGALPSASSLR